jgi:hypothetical protein
MYDVGFREYGASAGDPDGIARPKGVISKFSYFETKSFSLTVQKGTGTRRADGIHGEIGDDAVIQQYDF